MNNRCFHDFTRYSYSPINPTYKLSRSKNTEKPSSSLIQGPSFAYHKIHDLVNNRYLQRFTSLIDPKTMNLSS